MFDHLQTPGNKPQQGQGAETPLSEVIERNLKAAVANSNRSHVTSLAAMTASPQLGKEPEPEVDTDILIYTHNLYVNADTYRCVYVMQVEQKAAAPLSGVVVCVSKKLSKKQSELNAVAASLGADFRYMPIYN